MRLNPALDSLEPFTYCGTDYPTRLDANESCVPLSEGLRRELADAILSLNLNCYPDDRTVALRQEWGFAGLVMSDWNTTVPQDGSTPWRCAWAGNDVIMPGNPHDDADIRAALADGRLPETAARQSAARLIALASALRGE